jgi:hypothetical protein
MVIVREIEGWEHQKSGRGKSSFQRSIAWNYWIFRIFACAISPIFPAVG